MGFRLRLLLPFLVILVWHLSCHALHQKGEGERDKETKEGSLPSFILNILVKLGIKKNHKTFVVPGTKWCGIGNIAQHNNDLGRYSGVDKCCRDHDLCPGAIKRGERKHGIRNKVGHTIKPCDTCDEKLRDCLREGNSLFKYLAGKMIFHVVKLNCYDREETENGKFIVTGIRSLKFEVSWWKWYKLYRKFLKNIFSRLGDQMELEDEVEIWSEK